MISDVVEPCPKWLTRLIWAALFFALLRNLFPPNAFTATVLIFDYEFGLVRRGFWGEVLNLYWGDTVSKSEVFAASAALTLAGVAGLMMLLMRRLATTFAGGKLLLLVVTSFAFAALISATGYIDLPLICMVSLCLLTSPARPLGIALRCGVAAVGMFMHEVMLAFFVIFLVYDIWLAGPVLRRVWVAVLPFLAAILAFGVLLEWGQLPPERAADYAIYIEAKSEFKAEPDATIVMQRTMSDNLAMMVQKRTMSDYKSWVLFDGLPLLAMTVWLIFLNLRVLPRHATVLTRVLLVGAIVAPMSLNIIAFDVVRFGAVSVLVGFMTLVSLIRQTPDALERIGAALSWPVMVVVLVLNLNVSVNQMNTGDAHEYGVPWALIKQLNWIR